MGIREMFQNVMGIGVEQKHVVEERVVRKHGYEISAVCDTREEIEQSNGVGIGIGGDDDETR